VSAAAVANNRDHNNTNAEQAAVPSVAHQQNSDQDCRPNAEKDGSDDLSQQIRELRQEIRALRDDEQKSMKKLQQQIEEQEKEWIHALQGIYGG